MHRVLFVVLLAITGLGMITDPTSACGRRHRCYAARRPVICSDIMALATVETAPSAAVGDPRKSLKEEKAKPVRTWQFDIGNGGVGTISGRDGGDWIEPRGKGEVPSTFTFVRRTNRFTELYDKDRNFTLILYWDGESEWTIGMGWNTWLKGKWLEEK
jgi:hypothetical protein